MLNAIQIADVAKTAGFAGLNLVVAVAIALAESGGNPEAHGDIHIGSGKGSIGLWQIYLDAHPEYGDGASLFDPQANANAAHRIYLAALAFTPWSTYKNGAYTYHMRDAWEGVTGAGS